MHDSGRVRKLALWLNRKAFRSVYLCGGINGLGDSDCRNWRENAKAELTVPTVDPMRRDYRGIEHANYKSIVHGDLWDIAFRSGVVLVNATKPSWGTAMEVVVAWLLGKEVVAFVGIAAISPWLKYFADSVNFSFLDALKYINAKFK